MDKGLIYKITCLPTGKCYIGKTIRPLSERLKNHFSGYDSCRKLNEAIKIYGKDNFDVKVIASNIPYNELDSLEVFYINEYNSVNNGYNIKYGNKNSKGRDFHIISPEVKAKTIELYNSGLIPNIIADILSISRTSVYNILEEFNIPRYINKSKFNLGKSKIDFETFRRLKLDEWKTKQLAEYFGVAKSSIKRYFNRHKDIILPRVSNTLTDDAEGEDVL